MISIYWFTFGFGGIFLLFTVFLGADSDGDADVDGSVDADGIVAGDVGQLNADSHGHMGETTHPPVLDILFFLLSLRFWAFFTCFFGMTGVGGYYIIGGGISTLVSAIIMGTVAGFSASYLFKYLSRGNVSTDVSLTEAVGQMAEVTIPVAPGDPGKVRVLIKGQIVERKAVCDDASLELGTRVRIVGFKQNLFIVTAAETTAGKEEI